MATNNLILKISNSRKNILDILEIHQGYDVSAYKNFSINEIDAMYSNEQLDIMVQHKTTGVKTYVKYYVSRKFMPNALENISSQMFEDTLSKNDTLILIILDEPNDGMLSQLNHLFKNKGVFVVIHNIKRLQYNILDHELVPSMSILSSVEVEWLMKDTNLTSLKQLPEISRFDPQALAMSMRPGQVGVFARKSVTTLENNYYRICA